VKSRGGAISKAAWRRHISEAKIAKLGGCGSAWRDASAGEMAGWRQSAARKPLEEIVRDIRRIGWRVAWRHRRRIYSRQHLAAAMAKSISRWRKLAAKSFGGVAIGETENRVK